MGDLHAVKATVSLKNLVKLDVSLLSMSLWESRSLPLAVCEIVPTPYFLVLSSTKSPFCPEPLGLKLHYFHWLLQDTHSQQVFMFSESVLKTGGQGALGRRNYREGYILYHEVVSSPGSTFTFSSFHFSPNHWQVGEGKREENPSLVPCSVKPALSKPFDPSWDEKGFLLCR